MKIRRREKIDDPSTSSAAPVASGVTRREFVGKGAGLALGATVVPRHVLGGVNFQAPSDKLNVAIIGVGGRGTELAQGLGSEQISAVCDVDFGVVNRRVLERLYDGDGEPREKGFRWQQQFRQARRYTDFREMLAQEGDELDAVVVATPDHLHAPIAVAAMEAGKHVYMEKPLAATLHETRVLAEVAEKSGVVTQMGNQGHTRDETRKMVEVVQSGLLGEVKTVYIWTNRPIWPQGVLRPQRWEEGLNPGWYQQWHQGAVNAVAADVMDAGYKLPTGMDWDLYLGPVAKEIPYHPIYHPFNWRGWVDFGVGALGDMGAHLVDLAYWALDLGWPESVEATSTPWGGPADDPVSFPLATRVHYHFPARGALPPLDMHWYDGGLMPPRPAGLPEGVKLNREGGAVLVGERGLLTHETYGVNPQIFPESLAAEAEEVPQSLPRIEDGHQMDWVNACKAGGGAAAGFAYAADLTDVLLLGIVALRAGQGKMIRYDGEARRITNDEEANRFLTREYRDGWEV